MVERVKNEIKSKKNIFWMLVFSIFIFAGAYVSLVSHTIYNVVLRQRTEKNILALQSDIVKVESQYFDTKAKVTVDLAKTKGFTNISSSVFISKKPAGKVLTLNNEI